MAGLTRGDGAGDLVPPRRRRPVLRAGLAAVAAAVAVLAMLGPLTRTRVVLGPSTVEVAATVGRHGTTEIEVPPLGRVSAATHAPPVRLRVSLVELDVEGVQSTFGTSLSSDAARAAIEDDLPDAVARVLRRSLILAAAVGAVAAAVPPGRRWWHLPIGAVTGTVAMAVALGATWRSFDEAAFAEPRFTGALARAPAVVEAVQRNVAGLDEVRDRVETLSAQLDDLFAAAAGARPLDDGADTTILHVSDIHSNPLAVALVNQLAEAFVVDAVLDTGDLTSFGSPVEARIGDLIAGIPVPYYLAPGNHDSSEVRQALATMANVTVLDRSVVDIDGVRVLGVADPTFTADNRVGTAEATAEKQRQAADVARLTTARRPDVLAVHDAALAGAVAGDVPLVVSGHSHKRGDVVHGGTRFLSVGSTGATGLGSFTVAARLDYEAEVLHFSGGQLVTVDYVSLGGVGGSFRIDRTIVEPIVSPEPARTPPDPEPGAPSDERPATTQATG